MRNPRQLILALAVTAAAVACERPAHDTVGTAGTAPDGARPTGTAGDRRDAQQFTNDLGSGNMTEIELGRLAQQKAASPDVKAFGEMMVRDHTKALDALRQVADTQNLQVPAKIDEKNEELIDRLSAFSGGEFDREYMKAMVEKHEATLEKLEGKAADGSDPMQLFSSETLPTVRRHLEHAQQTLDRLSGGR